MSTWHSPKAVAERLGISVRSVRRLMDRGELPKVKIGGLVRVHDEDLTAYEARQRATEKPPSRRHPECGRYRPGRDVPGGHRSPPDVQRPAGHPARPAQLQRHHGLRGRHPAARPPWADARLGRRGSTVGVRIRS
ncbi:helix-turn-helix domain-containing protein, partial [Micromonospora sp. NPDC005171]|uniref:helix-turn-helix domain-containing protein n=1 Tax=Micromonospora sp. NPDC005171 TaxID=3156866 RepID=UPI00339E4BFD